MPVISRSLVVAALAATALTSLSVAQEDTIAAPVPSTHSYDPQLSAKEAVLANWELAAAGILAGHVVGRQVVALAEQDVPYARVLRQAQFAEKTILQRYNSAAWVFAGDDTLTQLEGDKLRALVLAVASPCESDPCASERAALQDAFRTVTEDLRLAAFEVRAAIDTRVPRGDAALMAEQLTVIANYLDSTAWADALTLAEFERDSEEISARIVGAMALWKNVEPYVGLTNPEVDAAVNTATRDLLRTLRYITRETPTMAPEGPEIQKLKAASQALAAEFRRAAALFAA